MVNARNTLLAMYSHLEEDSPVKSFIDTNCIHLTKPSVGHTGIPESFFDVSNWTVDSKYTMGPTSIDSRGISSLPDKTGAYTLYSIPSDKFYIGSTTDFDTRFNNHYADSIKPELLNRLLYVEVTKVG